MTFAEMAIEVYRQTGYDDVPAAKVAARVKGWLNRGHKHILRLPGMTELRRRTLHFDSIANQKSYSLALAFERIDAVMQTPNSIRLMNMDRDTYRLIDPGEQASGTPYQYIPEGWQPVYRQPDPAGTTGSGGTGIWVVSSNAADTTQIVKLRGIRRSGDPQAMLTATLNGVTRVEVTAGFSQSYVNILSWDISAVASGEVSLYNAAVGGDELARIPIGFTSTRYWMMRLWPTPSSVATYTVDGQVEVYDMIEDMAVSCLPPSYDDLLVAYARMCEYERTADGRRALAAQEWTNGIANLTKFVNFPPDYRPVAGALSGSGLGYTDLPGSYPADWSWP